MSHELRTPLNGIFGFAELLNDCLLPADQKEFVEMIIESTESLVAIVNDLLDISKIEAGKLTIETKLTDIHTLINQCIDLIKQSVEKKNIKINLLINPETPRFLFVDSIRFCQVMINLLNNAIKFTPSGHIDISVKSEVINSICHLNISVKDTGIGIMEENRSKIFQLFSQVDNSYSRQFGGTGLGLAITKEIIQKMNGSIDFRNVLDSGTEFFLQFR